MGSGPLWRGNLDIPTHETLQLGERNIFAGWVLLADGADVIQVDVVHGSEVVGACSHGLPREDVRRDYPGWPGAAGSGFRGEIDVPPRPTAPVVVRVWDSRGRRHEAFTVDMRLALFRRDPRYATLAGVNRTIHPDCEMYGYALRNAGGVQRLATQYYFASGEFLVRSLLAFADERGLDLAGRTILDFASGYGRLARYFVKLFARVTVADTEPAMLQFLRQQLGVEGFLSPAGDTSAIEAHPHRYDVVFCFSLFTHLSPRVWGRWFRALFDLVHEGGHLLISTHDEALLPRVSAGVPGCQPISDPEFAFLAGNETAGRLDRDLYGTSVVTADFVRRVSSATPGCRMVHRFGPGEFDLYHDVYVFARDR